MVYGINFKVNDKLKFLFLILKFNDYQTEQSYIIKNYDFNLLKNRI